jgi:hypothetical protein
MVMDEIEAIFPMFDCSSPHHAGSLAGEFLASALERQPRYPRLDIVRHAALFGRFDLGAQACIDNVLAVLPGLGFDPEAIEIYRRAALASFRSVYPPRRRSMATH